MLAGSFDYSAITKAAAANKKAAQTAYTDKGCTGAEAPDTPCGRLHADVVAADEAFRAASASEAKNGKGDGGGSTAIIIGAVVGVLACCAVGAAVVFAVKQKQSK